MKTLGIIGGLGPESTIDYYQNIIRLYRERERDGKSGAGKSHGVETMASKPWRGRQSR